MTRRAVWRWFADWRNGATIAASIVAVIVLVIVVDAVRARHEALSALRVTAEQAVDARRAATRRIDLLSERIVELERSTSDAGAEVSRLRAEVAALQQQLRQLGAEPVVAERAGPTTTLPRRGQEGTPPPTTTPAPTTTTMTAASCVPLTRLCIPTRRTPP